MSTVIKTDFDLEEQRVLKELGGEWTHIESLRGQKHPGGLFMSNGIKAGMYMSGWIWYMWKLDSKGYLEAELKFYPEGLGLMAAKAFVKEVRRW